MAIIQHKIFPFTSKIYSFFFSSEPEVEESQDLKIKCTNSNEVRVEKFFKNWIQINKYSKSENTKQP